MIALGDAAERFLRLLGITKELVSTVVGGDCGCEHRKQAMNKAGYVWQGKMLVPVRQVLYYYEDLRNVWRKVWQGWLPRRIGTAAYHLRMAVRVLLYGR